MELSHLGSKASKYDGITIFNKLFWILSSFLKKCFFGEINIEKYYQNKTRFFRDIQILPNNYKELMLKIYQFLRFYNLHFLELKHNYITCLNFMILYKINLRYETEKTLQDNYKSFLKKTFA